MFSDTPLVLGDCRHFGIYFGYGLLKGYCLSMAGAFRITVLNNSKVVLTFYRMNDNKPFFLTGAKSAIKKLSPVHF